MYVQSRRYWRECRTLSGRRCLGYRPRNWDISQQINKMKTPMCGGRRRMDRQFTECDTTKCADEYDWLWPRTTTARWRRRRRRSTEKGGRTSKTNETNLFLTTVWKHIINYDTSAKWDFRGERSAPEHRELERRKCPYRDEGENEK